MLRHRRHLPGRALHRRGVGHGGGVEPLPGVGAAAAPAEFRAEQRHAPGAVPGEFGGGDCHGVQRGEFDDWILAGKTR